MKFLEKIFSVKNIEVDKVITIFGFQIRFKNKHVLIKEIRDTLFEMNLQENAKMNNPLKSISEFKGTAILDLQGIYVNVKDLFPQLNFLKFNEENLYNTDNFFIWGTHAYNRKMKEVQIARFLNRPINILEMGFFFGADTFVNYKCDEKYRTCISYVMDSVVPYYDARYASSLEKMINDSNIVVTEEQKQRARRCIDKIVETHLTKYNHQPIFEPEIGRKGVKKVLVVDQSFGDMSISKGWGNEYTFKNMLECAIKENPDADIIVKTHPDTMTGNRGGYFTGLVPHDNIYTQTEPINPISLIKYVDKVYVCTTQFGFEALMCGKDVRVFGMPFYANWGLTQDELTCERRTNTRTLEEVFYLAYIAYSHYVHPETKQIIEIEEAMDYLLQLRDEYMELKRGNK